jgi:transposase-like protein
MTSRVRSSNVGRRVRRPFREEFLTRTVRPVLNEGKTVGVVAGQLDLTPSALANWVRHARAWLKASYRRGSRHRAR